MNIKALASQKNISFKELSRRVNKSEQGLYKSLENNSINIKTLADIAEVLEVCISELIADKAYKEVKNSESVSVYKKLVQTQEQLIHKNEKLYKYEQEKNEKLLTKVEDLKIEVKHLKGYGIAAEPKNGE